MSIERRGIANLRWAARLTNPESLRFVMTVGAGWGGRVVTALAQFVAVRILTTMLGIDGYGAYAVLTGLLAWFLLADFGLGASLQNYISQRRVAGETSEPAIRSVTYLLLGSTLVLCVLIAVASKWIGPFLLSGFDVPYDQAIAGFATFGILAAATGAASIALKICFAEHRGYLAHAITASGALFGLIGLKVVDWIQPDHLFVWALGVMYLPGLLLATGLLFWRLRGVEEQDDAGGHPRANLWPPARSFLLFGILSALVLNLDYVVLARVLPPREVATYAILSKLYGLVFFAFSSVLQAYWSVSAEALHRGDAASVKRVARTCLMFGAVIVLSTTFLLLTLLGPITRLLAPKGALVISVGLLPYFAVYSLLRVWSDTFSTIIMSAGKAVVLCMIVPVQAVFSLTLEYLGAHYYGLPGFMLGLSASFVLTVAWALPLYLLRVSKRLNGAMT
jgi:O-antigen/teichoic acid export membrane protein